MMISNTNRFLVLSLTLFLLIAVTGSLRRAKTSSAVTPSAATLVAGAIQGGPVPTRMLRVFLQGDDIYPNEIHVKAGSIRLRAENETLGDVSLALDSVPSPPSGQPSQRVTTIQTLNRSKRADQVVSVSKGEYAYYEESRPEVRGRLIVDAE